ncbi:MAG: glycosyltransferase family 2 protein [Thermoplasmata archaeon]
MVPAPEVAIVVGAYSRGTYLLDAVRSVLDQTLPRDRWELLVVKNFRDETIDAALARDGVTTRWDETPRVGTWLLQAIRATRAPIVTLLDDDDLYLPGRLARIVETFRSHPEVGFYRNRVEIVDENGGPVPVAKWAPRGTDPYFDASGPVLLRPGEKSDVVDLLYRRTRVSFNSSTMAFRRELLDGRLGEHFAASRLPDSSLLLSAVLSPYGIYLDDQRETRHRLHSQNVTRGVGWLRWAVESHRAFADEAREFGRLDLERYHDGLAIHFERLSRSGELVQAVAERSGRREVVGRAADYARFLARNPAERSLSLDVWAAEAYAATYLVSPSLAGRVHRAREGRRIAREWGGQP